MPNQPLVSVIIPAHNGEPFLSEAIESILQQDYPYYEIWVIDNASTDATARIAQSYPQIHYIHTDIANVNLSRNQGITSSKGEYIAFLDQDDIWTTSKLRQQVEFLNTHPEYGAVIGKQQMFLESGTEKPHWLKQAFLDTPQPAYLPSTLMLRRTILKQTELFNQDLMLTSDVAWFFRAQDLGISIKMLDSVLIHRRIHGDNASSGVDKLQQELLTIIRSSLKDRRERPEHA